MKFISNNFKFLEKHCPDLYELADSMETNIYDDFHIAYIKGNIFFDNIMSIIFDKEASLMYFKKEDNFSRNINLLYRKNIIHKNMNGVFHKARIERNKGVHSNGSVKGALTFNEALFKIAYWFINRYYETIPEPDYVKPTEQKHIEHPFLPHEINSIDDSYLFNELSKLNIASKEAVEDSEGLNEFKEYLHIERKIENDFKDVLERSKNVKSKLIMLLGSVGDGKSHLISQMQTKYSKLMNSFDVHNDATESFDPNLTAIDTLLKRLNPFNDQNIKNSNEKLILAINFGVLNDLLNNEDFKENFRILSSELTGVIDSKDNLIDESKNINIINFNNYSISEFEEGDFNSKFLIGLFDKITALKPENPFYNAYKKDLENGITHPILINYTMLMNPEVKNSLIQLILKHAIINKKIISIREIFNFIYEILVPANIKDKHYVMDDLNTYSDDLLPVLLFNTKNRSGLLNGISQFNPFNARNDFVDDFLISLNSMDLDKLYYEYFDDYKELSFIDEFIKDGYDSLDRRELETIKENLLYFALFFGKESFKKGFGDKSYDEFIENLGYYHDNNHIGLFKLFKKVKNAIFKWKGEIRQNILLIDQLDNFKIGKEVKIELDNIEKDNLHMENSIKFHCSLNDNSSIILNMDYSLYDMIIKINDGYKPNKLEKQNLIVFDDFIKKILSQNDSDSLFIEYSKENKNFTFKKQSDEIYSFDGDN